MGIQVGEVGILTTITLKVAHVTARKVTNGVASPTLIYRVSQPSLFYHTKQGVDIVW